MELVTWKVIAIDDDTNNLDNLERIFSKGIENNRFDFVKFTSFNDGLNAIIDRRFDFVFLDVHENMRDPDPGLHPEEENQRGEYVLREIQKKRFIPIIFYTGFPDKVDHLKSPVIKVVDKGSSIGEIRDAAISILDTKLPLLSKYIEEESREYLWESIGNHWDKYPNSTNTAEISLLAARQLANKLSQHVVKDIIGLDKNSINPLEMYLYPPRHETCSPADIFIEKTTNQMWMVLTPACDFAQEKAEHVLLARIFRLTEHSFFHKWKQLEDAHPDKKAAFGNLKSLVKGKAGERFKYLPSTFFIEDSIIDFQQLRSLSGKEAENFEILCSIDNPYREEILIHFSKYFGRIGTPDYSFDEVWRKIEVRILN
jgi:CheY-like chemotaxis protein